MYSGMVGTLVGTAPAEQGVVGVVVPVAASAASPNSIVIPIPLYRNLVFAGEVYLLQSKMLDRFTVNPGGLKTLIQIKNLVFSVFWPISYIELTIASRPIRVTLNPAAVSLTMMSRTCTGSRVSRTTSRSACFTDRPEKAR